MKFFKLTVMILLGAMLLFSVCRIYCYYSTETKVEKEFNDLAKQIRSSPIIEDSETKFEQPTDAFYDVYGTLKEQNSDMVGWIVIDGTNINYPVMHTPNNPDYYLKHNFEKKYSNYGVPYVDNNCSLDPQSTNLIIYGHHMKGGKMFGALEGYKSMKFYQNHSIIRFDTLIDRSGKYQIIAVFTIDPANFLFNRFVETGDEDEFDEYIHRCKELSFYDTGVDAQLGDKLITLSTCEYSQRDNRLVVVAKKIE